MWTAALLDAVLCGAAQQQGGSFSLLFSCFSFDEIRIIGRWNILCHGNGCNEYVPRSLIQ
jgi:hypothetical protein